MRNIWGLLFASLTVGCAHHPCSQLKSFTFRMVPGQDVKVELQKFAKQNHLKAAAIVSAVGSLNQVSLRYANAEDSTVSKGFHEIVSITGTLTEDSVHLHMAVADKNGHTLGGHLTEGNLVYTTLEIVVLEQLDLSFTRELDSTYGYNELVVKKR